MNLSWYVFYGRQMNMKRQEVINTSFGEMQDMVNCLSIFNGGADQKIKRRKLTFDEALSLR